MNEVEAAMVNRRDVIKHAAVMLISFLQVFAAKYPPEKL